MRQGREHESARGSKDEARRTDSGRRVEDRSFAHFGGGARTTTDHDEIREWAEAHGGRPAAVTRTHRDGDVGIVRLMFPDAPNAEHAGLTEIGWREFFAEFEKRKLALLYDPNSLFSKMIGRDTVGRRTQGDNKAAP